MQKSIPALVLRNLQHSGRPGCTCTHMCHVLQPFFVGKHEPQGIKPELPEFVGLGGIF